MYYVKIKYKKGTGEKLTLPIMPGIIGSALVLQWDMKTFEYVPLFDIARVTVSENKPPEEG